MKRRHAISETSHLSNALGASILSAQSRLKMAMASLNFVLKPEGGERQLLMAAASASRPSLEALSRLFWPVVVVLTAEMAASSS